MIAIFLTSGLGFLLAWFSVRKILKLEDTAARHFEEINHARTELKQLSARLLDAQEEERRSISRELHDEVGQSLSGVLVEMANLSNIIRGPEQAEQKADEIKKLLENSIGVVRNMSLLLRPSMLDDLGLVPALQWQAREASKRSALWVKVDAEHVSDDLGEEYKTCVYRVVQEALHNIVQHAKAQNVKVTVVQEPDRLMLSIQDDGAGFNPREERGMGLLGMEERVGSLGGRLSIESVKARARCCASCCRCHRVFSRTPNDAMKTIRILLADDHTIVRKGLRMLLESHEGFQVVGRGSGWPGGRRAGGAAPARRDRDGHRHADSQRDRSGAADLRERAATGDRVPEHAFRRGIRLEGAQVRRSRVPAEGLGGTRSDERRDDRP